MATLLQTDLPAIMAATEQQLLNYVSPVTGKPLVGDISNIYQVFSGEEPVAGTTGQRDVLLVERDDNTEGMVVGAGRLTWLAAGLDVYLRSTLAADRRSSYKQWKITHRQFVNVLMDALMGFFPVDASGNAYTIEGFVLDRNAVPVKDRDSLTWGRTVSTYRFHYMPDIDTGILG